LLNLSFSLVCPLLHFFDVFVFRFCLENKLIELWVIL